MKDRLRVIFAGTAGLAKDHVIDCLRREVLRRSEGYEAYADKPDHRAAQSLVVSRCAEQALEDAAGGMRAFLTEINEAEQRRKWR